MNLATLQYSRSTQKLVIFLYINNEQTKNKVKKTSSFTIAPRRIKYLLINLTTRYKTYTLETTKHCQKKLKTCINGKLFSVH